MAPILWNRAWRGGAVGAVVALGLVAACDRSDLYSQQLAARGAYVLADAYVTWDAAHETLAWVAFGDRVSDRHRVRHVAVGEGSAPRVFPTVDRTALLVLDPAERALFVVDGAADRPARYELGQPFDTLSLSDDGRFALVFAGAGAQSEGTVAVSQSLIAVVDLSRPPAEADATAANPRVFSVSSYGGARLGIDVSPEFTADGTPRRMAVVRSEGHVALFDLLAPASAPIAVPLVVPGDPVDLKPTAAQFRVNTADRGGLWVFFAATGSGDIFELRVAPPVDSAPGVELAVRLNQHPVGGAVSAFVPVALPSGATQVLALSAAARKLVLIDIATSAATTFVLDAAYSALALFEIADDAGEVAPHALLTAPGTNRMATLALADVGRAGVKALRPRALRAAYTSVVPLADTGRFAAFDLGGSGQASVTLGWVGREAAEESIRLGGAVTHHIIDGAGIIALLVQAADGMVLVRIDPVTGLPGELRLDDGAVRVDAVPGLGWWVITHDAMGGLVTLVDPAAFERAATVRLQGFLLDGLFDGEGGR